MHRLQYQSDRSWNMYTIPYMLHVSVTLSPATTNDFFLGIQGDLASYGMSRYQASDAYGCHLNRPD